MTDNIVIAGDFCPSRDVDPYDPFAVGVRDLFHNSIFSIVNLEAPLTDRGKPILKTGPNLRLSPRYAEIMKSAGIDCVSLANNHMGDFGEVGVEDTIKYCKDVGLDIVGAGCDRDAAAKPLIISIVGLRVAVLNACEWEFGLATSNNAGANPYNLIDIVRQVWALRPTVDRIIFIYHGGLEHQHYPTITMVKDFQFLIDVGIDAIYVHHAHAYSGFEIYNDRLIQYGLGNFYFSMKNKEKDEKWSIGLVAMQDLKDSIPNFCLTPVEQCPANRSVEICSGGKKYECRQHIVEISNTITNPKSLAEVWRKNYSEHSQGLYRHLLCRNDFLRKVAKKTNIRLKTNKTHQAILLNLFRCQSHREKAVWILSQDNE